MRPAFRVLFSMLMIVAGVVITSCGRVDGAGAEVTLDVAQTSVGPAQVDVTLRDAGGRAIDGADVQLRGDMTHAGMRPVLTTMESVGDGLYRASDFEFTMAGDWVLTVEATLPNGERVSRMFEVRGVTEER